MRTTTRFGLVLGVAAEHHDLITTAQLKELGFDRTSIRHLVEDRLIERIIRGLYRIPGTRSPEQDIAAAIMRHTGGTASHRSGLLLHDLTDRVPPRPDITVPKGRSTGESSLGTLHRSPLTAQDVVVVNGIQTTTVARSIVDAARYLHSEKLGHVVNVAVSRRAVSIGSLVATVRRLENEPGRIGHRWVREVLRYWTDDIRPDSPAEAAVLRRIRDAGLPVPETQVEIFDDTGAFVARVDLAWTSERVIREYDSDLWHGPDRTEADEIRRERLESLGWAIGPIARVDLRPSSTRWLRKIAADLGRGASLAS